MSGTMKGLKRTFSKLTLRRNEAMQQKQAGRILSLNGLHKLWNTLQALDQAQYEEDSLKKIGMDVLDLEANVNESDAARLSRFFIPRPPSYIKDHPIDQEDEGNSSGILIMKNVATHDPDWSDSPYDLASSLSSALAHAFTLRRMGRGEKIRLREISEWKRAPFFPSVFDEAFVDDIVRTGTIELEAAWHAHDPALKPHVMIAIAQEAAGIHDKVLRTELLTIMAIMITRLVNDRFENHTIIPVMLFSFMGNRRGRILQACFTGGKLIIRKSKLYDFSTPDNAELSLDRFLQYMVSDLVGNTALTAAPERKMGRTPSLSNLFNRSSSVRGKSSRGVGEIEMSG